jgi:hypothetical protein
VAQCGNATEPYLRRVRRRRRVAAPVEGGDTRRNVGPDALVAATGSAVSETPLTVHFIRDGPYKI